MDSPSVDESIKTDVLKMIFNLVCNVDSAKFRVVENDGIAILWRYPNHTLPYPNSTLTQP